MDYSFFEKATKNQSVEPAYLLAGDGTKLAYFYYQAPVAADNNRVLVFYHGGGAYQVDAYQQMARELAEKHGMSSYLFDIRGHGLSGGERGDGPTVDRILLDVQDSIAFVKKQHPSAVLYAGGHSSGCGLLMHAMQKGYVPQGLAGVIFIAPFLGADSKLVLKTDFIKKVAVWRFIWHAITGFCLHQPAVFFHYPDWLRERSPLLLDHYTVAMALAITPDSGDTFLKNFPLPLQIVIGNDDKQISSATLQQWQEAGKLPANVKLTVCPDAGHFSILAAAGKIVEL